MARKPQVPKYSGLLNGAFGALIGFMTSAKLLDLDGHHSLMEILAPPYVWEVVLITASTALMSIGLFALIDRIIGRK